MSVIPKRGNAGSATRSDAGVCRSSNSPIPALSVSNIPVRVRSASCPAKLLTSVNMCGVVTTRRNRPRKRVRSAWSSEVNCLVRFEPGYLAGIVSADQIHQEQIGVDEDAGSAVARHRLCGVHATDRIFMERTAPVAASTSNIL